jgi:hypothetical protein
MKVKEFREASELLQRRVSKEIEDLPDAFEVSTDYWRQRFGNEDAYWKSTAGDLVRNLYFTIGVKSDASFHSIWVYMFTDEILPTTHYGARHKHHTCVYQDPAPRRGNMTLDIDEATASVMEWVHHVDKKFREQIKEG